MPDIPRDRYIGDMAEGNPLIERDPGVLRSDRNVTSPLAAQLPGLDRNRWLRDASIRVAAWVRERPDIVFGALGSVIVLGVGSVLAIRRHRARNAC